MIDIFPFQYDSAKFNLYFQFLSTFLGTILMKWIVISALIGFILSLIIVRVSHSQETLQDSQFEQDLREARKVSAELAEKVRGLLLQEIERGGFVNAVRVCSELAQEITQQFNKGTGHYVRRVSLKYRNPKNIPDDYDAVSSRPPLLSRRRALWGEICLKTGALRCPERRRNLGQLIKRDSGGLRIESRCIRRQVEGNARPDQ